MRASRLAPLALLLAPALGGCSCSSKPSADPAGPAAVADVKPVAAPAELVGKWRFEQKEGGSTRVTVYRISADGYIDVDSHITNPEREVRAQTKTAITQVEGDKLTVVDVSRTSDENEEVIPADRRRTRTVQYGVAGDKLHWGRENETPWVLTRVKN
jgi:hypothetical protein